MQPVSSYCSLCRIAACVVVLQHVSSCSPQAELKARQALLVSQLLSQLQASLGPPLRTSLGRAFVALYGVGDSFSLHESVGKCWDTLRAKEDSGSSVANKL